MTSSVTDPKIRVLIADDHPIFREGLTKILSLQKDMKVIGEASDGEEACRLYDQLSPDILILDPAATPESIEREFKTFAAVATSSAQQ